jgi:DNA-directed RNA polymerase subunit omega
MSAGAELLVERDNDKNTVVALREIADEQVVPAEVREDLVSSLQKQIDIDEPDEDIIAAPRLGHVEAGAEAGAETAAEPMAEMSEDDILAALQSLEAAGPKDKGDGRGD